MNNIKKFEDNIFDRFGHRATLKDFDYGETTLVFNDNMRSRFDSITISHTRKDTCNGFLKKTNGTSWNFQM